MSSQYSLLNWEQSRVVPVEAFTLLGSVGKAEKAANVPEEVTRGHNYHSCVLLPPSTPT